jgi:hypothetical protein
MKIVYRPDPKMIAHVLQRKSDKTYVGTKDDEYPERPMFVADIAQASSFEGEQGHVDAKDIYEWFTKHSEMSWLSAYLPEEFQMVEYPEGDTSFGFQVHMKGSQDGPED